MILVVLLCPLYSIVYAIFKKQKNNQNGLCEHLLAQHMLFIFFARAQAKAVLKLELQAVIST